MKTIYFVDFDHTISRRDVWDTLVKTFSYEKWKGIIKEYLRGEISSRICNLRLAEIVPPREAEARELIYQIGIDPTFHEFVRWTQERQAELIIVSDGFDYYIDLLLQKEGLDFLTCYSNRLVWTSTGIEVEFPLYRDDCERDMAHCKCQHVLRYAGEQRIYIGDGISDTCAARKCERIYAKHNLLSYCREHGIACEEFGDFLDVLRAEERFEAERQGAAASAS